MLGRRSIFYFDAAVALALLSSVSAAAAAAPVVDTQAPSPVTVVTREELEKLPTGRSVADLLKACPARTIPTATSPPKGDRPSAPAPGPSCIQPDDLRMIDIYKRHNQERAPFGYRPLRWNSALEATATARAQQLAHFRQLIHAPREGRGIERENLLGAPVGRTPDQMVNQWVGEKRNFRPGVFPNVCNTGGDCPGVWHYTQMIWPTTTDIGCGMAPGGGFNWLVCRYSPGGNKDGKRLEAAVSPGPGGMQYPIDSAKSRQRLGTPGQSHKRSNLEALCASSGKELRSIATRLEQLKARRAKIDAEMIKVQNAIGAAQAGLADYDPSLIEELLGTAQAPSNEQMAALTRRLAELQHESRSLQAETKTLLQKLQKIQTSSGICGEAGDREQLQEESRPY